MNNREAIVARLSGIHAIPVTPFRDDLSIDEAAIGVNIERLIAGGMTAVYPCGNTGEFYSLTVEEAEQTVRLTVQQVQGRALVMAGVGYDTATAAQLAAAAAWAGADGLMVHQPVHPFQSEHGLLDYYTAIAAATDLPLILYVRSEQVRTATLLEAAEIPQVVGVKYAVNHLPSFAEAVQAIGERLAWICGTAEMWAPFYYAAGAVGFTSGMVNVDTRLSLALLAAMNRSDVAETMRIWQLLRPFELLREQRGGAANVSVVKEAMAQLGYDSGQVRPPIAALTVEDKQQVTGILRAWELLEDDEEAKRT
ncbi:dihydrodipicolinate synthase family protein [Paenibacillus sp. 1P07SE]|uniref:dihydrodipicolinate synthase family protein n=1 Tax=Paenibacillus sp. 1P07SE TaxID=3132209 RepID=UPI0039A7723C